MIRVLPIIINPHLTPDDKRLTDIYSVDIKSWYIDVLNDLREVFNEEFVMVEPIDQDWIPEKQDGFQYSSQEYLAVIQNPRLHHEPDKVNMWKFIDSHRLIDRKLANEFDEVHVLGGPFMGFYESQMVGLSAIPCNSEPIMASCPNFAIMGYNYERGRCEALEDMGHRAEFILASLYPNYMRTFNSGTGTIHKPFNTTKDYDWDNLNVAMEHLNGDVKTNNCTAWGCTGLGYIKWWFSRLAPEMRRDVIHFDNWKR